VKLQMPMTSRERVLTVINHEQPDRIPVVIGANNATGIKMKPYQGIKDLAGIQAPDKYIYAWPELGLPFGSVAEVREEVRRVMQILGPGGGCMIGPVHTVMNDVPPQNILAMVDAVEEFGHYPL